MAVVNNKHTNVQRVFYSGFDGGLNLSVPNEALPKNELKEAVNVEFSPLTGCMKVRGGLVWSGRFEGYPENGCIVPVQGRRGFLMRDSRNLKAYYFRWNNVWAVRNDLSNSGSLSIAPWIDEYGNDCWMVASGGKLQKFSERPIPKLRTIENSPDDCRFVFIREGRVCVVNGENTINVSALGDCNIWENDPEDESGGQFLEIGYKDGMKINAVVPLSKDVIIFKSPEGEPDKGIIYRLTGEYPDWQVVEVAHNTGTFSQRSVCVVGNDIYYATVAGIATLSTVTSYGEIRTSWPDRKVNNALTPELDRTAQLYDVPVKQQLWVQPNVSSKKIWIFDYARGIWTTFEFPQLVKYAAGVDNRLFLFIEKDVYEVNDAYTQDELMNTGGKLQQYTITAKMRLGTLLNGMQTLIKGAFASFELRPSCNAELHLGKFKMPFSYGGPDEDYIYGDPNNRSSNYYQYASNDNDPLLPDNGVLTSRQECIVRDWAVTPEIIINGGGCSVSTIGLEVAEV